MKLFFSIFITILTTTIFADTKNSSLFITKPEYGKMLYENPRGIGCNSCHGNSAEGKKIVQFKHTYKEDVYLCTLYTPNIKNVSYENFKKKINQKRNPNKKFKEEEVCQKIIYNANIMPTYHLIEDEIESIYYYLKTLK